jgi:hypothetical protein
MMAVDEAQNLLSKSTALLTGRRGRPNRSSSTNAHSNQSNLHSWFNGASGGSKEGMCLTEDLDANAVKGLMCSGFRASYCLYNGLSYAVRGLLEDQMSGAVWFSEPHLCASLIVGGKGVKISGAF